MDKKTKVSIARHLFASFGLAEREGFEPPVQLPVHRISSAARSTTPASLQTYPDKAPQSAVLGLQI